MDLQEHGLEFVFIVSMYSSFVVVSIFYSLFSLFHRPRPVIHLCQFLSGVAYQDRPTNISSSSQSLIRVNVDALRYV